MIIERIQTIELTDENKLSISLVSGGDAFYQYVYREAAGVYWENEKSHFVSTELKSWSVPMWYKHIVQVATSCGVQLMLSSDTTWSNISITDKREIEDVSGK